MSRNHWLGLVAVMGAALAVSGSPALAKDDAPSLQDARKGHVTKLRVKETHDEPLVEPPKQLFSKVSFPGPLGRMSAYVGAKPKGEGKHPAIIWITGGFPPGGIGEDAWRSADPENDQTARAFRQSGMVLMFPTVRGSFGNPGHQEMFYGEVDDVLAAAEYLATVSYVDPERIYLGGHSTGGTLALLVAASSSRFKGVFSFGPVDDPVVYGVDGLPYDPLDLKERRLRAPVHYLGSIQSPTWVIEGTDGGNDDALLRLKKRSTNPKLTFVPVKHADHFNVLSSVTKMIAGKLATLTREQTPAFSAVEVQKSFDAYRRGAREANDLETLATARRRGTDLKAKRIARHYVLAYEMATLSAAVKPAKAQGFLEPKIGTFKDDDGDPYYVLFLRKSVVLGDLPAVFALSAEAQAIADRFGAEYDGWGIER